MPKSSTTAAITAWIDVAVRSGLMDEDELLEELEDRLGDVADDVVLGLQKELRHAIVARDNAAKSWPKRTVNDLIDRAFEALDDDGIIALHAVGSSFDDGWEDVESLAEELDEPARGTVFYPWSELEQALDGSGLRLAYGAFTGGDRASIAVGRDIVATLQEHGVPVEWTGHLRDAIVIKPFAWQRRYREPR